MFIGSKTSLTECPLQSLACSDDADSADDDQVWGAEEKLGVRDAVALLALTVVVLSGLSVVSRLASLAL